MISAEHRFLNALKLTVFVGLACCFNLTAQTLNLPPRATNAPTGTQFTNIIVTMPPPTTINKERENWILFQVMSGNVPNWLRTLKPINISASGHTATYHVLPDYLAIGSDTDYFLQPTTPLLAQRLADYLGCSLPTRKMVNQIWTNAQVKLSPSTIPPSAEMITVPVFAQHNATVRAQRNAVTNSFPLGTLVGGTKKDVVISTLIYSNLQAQAPKPVVIYGWHYTSGDTIQPLYNGHEETYADYSHGTRLVQMSMTVDGSPNTVTNVLTSATLATLLSDETVASNNRIPLPRYTIAPLAPVVMAHPRSQSTLPGTNLVLNVSVIGDTPLSYRWLLNSTNISGATNSSLVLSNVQPANAGNYSVIVTNAAGSATSRLAVVRIKTTDFPVLFADDFDTNSSANWNLFWGSANGIADYTADFAFDYGNAPYTFNGITALIPPSPNSPNGSTRGVRLTANNNDSVGATAAVNLYPKNFAVDGNFALKFDLWMNYPGNSGGFVGGISYTGTTQHAQCGINHLGTNVNWAATSATASDGVWFAVDGEGGTSRDYRAYVGNPGGLQTELIGAAASGLGESNNAAAVFTQALPATRFETAGSPGKNWVEVELRQTNNILVWIMDGSVIAQRTNSSAFKSGNVMIGLMDAFSSIAVPTRDCFVLFDNVRVENLSPPIRFDSIMQQPDGSVSLTLNSALGDSFAVETSTNLVSWQSLTMVNMTNNPATILDAGAGANAVRYYRARR